MLTFPQELQIGASEKFCIHFYNVSHNVDVNLNISCYGQSYRHHPKTFSKGESGCFVWQLPQSITPGTCDLDLKGEVADEDYTFSESREVMLVDTHDITFIQTDKPIYKPGDKVKFRILTVTQDLKPLKAEVDSVIVDDPQGFHMRQWLDIQPQAGLVSLEYRLYDEPELGTWKIVAMVNGRKTEQTFEVQQYVLPSFQVYMTLPKTLTVATKSVKLEVCAKYTFGKPVQGQVNASVCLLNTETSWFCEKQIRPCVQLESEIDGCHSFTMETKQLNLTARQFSLLCKPRLTVHANVTEKETGVTVEATQQGTGVWEERVKLKFVSQKYFKPFFPYRGQLYAWNPDGSPAVKEEIMLTIGKLGIEKTLITDSTGHIHFNIQDLTHATPYFIIAAKTKDREYTDTKEYTIYPASTRLHVKQWYSPTSSYIHLSTIYKGERRCGDTISIDVVYSVLPDVKIKSATTQIMSKGNILESTNVTHDMLRSSPYLPNLEGPVFTPHISQAQIPDSTEFTEDSNNLQPGPPDGYQAFAAGPPGSKNSQPAGPPGAQTGKEKVPAAPVESRPLGITKDETKIKPVSSSNVFTKQTPPTLRHFSFRQYISVEMSPKIRVLVYMVTDSGELIADTLDIDVQHCYDNKVNLTFKQKSVRPGERVDLTLMASPGSLCATGMVDKNVYLQAGDLNLLQRSHINDKLKMYDLTSDFINDWQYCSDQTILPPDLLNPGASISAAGSPGHNDDTDFLQAPFSRKKRSIMQYYSNMYDALLAFKIAGLTVMTDLHLQTRPCLHDGDILGPPFLPGDPRGPIPGPDGQLEGLEPSDEPVDTRDPVSNLRRNFPETWLWELYEVPASGTVTFTETIPDSITEWIGNSVCTSEKTGLGVSDIARVTSFQPFFTAVKLPYSVIRGEVVSVDIMVFNYLNHCIAVQLKIVLNEKFELVDGESEAQTCICKDQSDSHTFKIRPSELGRNTITFSAHLREHRESCYSAKAPAGYKNKQVTELLVKQLLVQAEGVEEETTESQFICPQDSPESFERTYIPKLPTDMLVPGSLRGWVNVMGDIMGPVLSGLEDLILLPTGCGEQNMIRLAPNIAILQYLTLTQQLTEDMKVKTTDHLNKGYQQQLKFMHKDGSYSAFGTADDAGSTWLSAFVFKTLQKSLDFIFVDRKQIQTKTWEFLINQQGEDGCFIEKGKVLSKYMMGGVAGSSGDRKRALTAYVLVTMLESFKMMVERTPPFVALAVRCIQVDNMEDTYTHALVAYAMTLYKPHSKFTDILLNRLMSKALKEDDTMHWRREKQPDIITGQGRAASAEIEITSYALLAILTQDPNAPISDVMPIIRWLTNQRNAYGGFASTQDTVVALQALSLFAQRIYGGGLSVNLNIADEQGTNKDVHVTHDNSIIKQEMELANPGSSIRVKAKGEGCVLMQMTYRYNVQNKLVPNDVFKLDISTPVTRESIKNNCRQRMLKVCASYHGSDEESNMAVIEVKLTSGWIADVASLQHLVNSVETRLKKYEMDKRYPDVVNFYFDQLSSSNLCFEFRINLEVEVNAQQPAMARVFDYYESEYETTIFYELTPCIELYLEQVDVSIVGEGDMFTSEEESSQLTINHNHLHSETKGKPTGDSSINVAGPEAGAPGPKAGPQCPLCYSTGTVNILENICSKQVWILDPVKSTEFSLWVMAADGVSPELSVQLPSQLSVCTDCQEFLTQSGEKSMIFLKPYDWKDLGMNIAQAETVVLPWSNSLQTSIQQVLLSCVYK